MTVHSKLETYRPTHTIEAGEFSGRRRAIAHRLFTEPTYSATTAMDDMGALTDSYLRALVPARPEYAVWAGGSLGRREMLPNSDLDLFAVGAEPTRRDQTLPTIPAIAGFDQVETGSISCQRLLLLADRTLIDLNQFIDGRALWQSSVGDEVTRILALTNTYDRQHANMIAEHFYYRHFDFLDKRTVHGPNVKYSSGSSRTTLFFNFYNRIRTGLMPASREAGPEFIDGVASAEEQLGLVGPYRSLDLIQVVKNAAISTFDATGDVRQRYVSPRSLDTIFALCEQRLRPLGHSDAKIFTGAYLQARREVEAAVDLVIEQTVRRHRSASALAELVASPSRNVPAALECAVEAYPDDASTVLALGAWSLVTRPDVTCGDVEILTKALTARDASETGGALMAVACCPVADSQTLRSVVSYLRHGGAGSYVLKLVSRNRSARQAIRSEAMAAYDEAEFVRVTG
ncbi:hypothetical protein CH302_01935 [Rhodococcus sp. 15-2388-1-1a]|uniref:nucleotidyltransferase domain-containing protein n=1 Tax=Nocardiaceae TaxID=85025 RepID=UPI00055FE0D7|nr:MULTISPECIES: nucleotidyltransferase domain-containing protein [Rhodococcus]OZF04209.1 hypothetical protein CH302_01935 [Rhodococcus sp. 15-2388-1-1a]